MSNPYLLAGSLLGATAVACGAFGAHALDGRLSPQALGIWETAALYHLAHAPVVVAIGLFLAFTRRRRKRALSGRDLALDRDGRRRAAARAVVRQARALKVAGLLLVLGVLLFSGTLYLLALDGPRMLAPVTPVGGVALIGGWLALAYGGLQQVNG